MLGQRAAIDQVCTEGGVLGRGGGDQVFYFYVLTSPTLTSLPLPPLSFSLLPLSSLSQSPGDEIDGPYAIFPGDQV